LKSAYVEFASAAGLALRSGAPEGGLTALRENPATFVDPALSSPEETAAFSRNLASIYLRSASRPDARQ
jgi:hypothetical protein